MALIKDSSGKIANTNEIPEDYRKTELGLLPEEWQIKKIGELFNVQQGISMSPARRDGPNKHPFLRTLNVFWSGIDLTTLDYMDFSDKEIEKLNLLPGDLLVCEGGDIGRTAMWRGELESCGYQNHLHRLRIKNTDVEPEFFMFWMQAAIKILGYYRDEGNETTIPNLSQSRLKNFSVPLPPLPEQHAIAATLRTVQEAKEKPDAVIAATQVLKAAMMKHLFTYGPVPLEEAERVALNETEIGPMSDGWDVVKIGDVIQKTQYGLSIRGEPEGQYPILRMNNLVNGLIQIDDLQFVNINENDLHNFQLNQGDILFNRTNSYELVGKTSIFNLNETFVFASYLVRIIPDFDKISPEYLNYYLNWGETQARLKLLASRGVSQSNINATKLRNFSIPFPSVSVQKQIATILISIDQKLAAEQSCRQALDTLFTTLLHDLMTAKIRVNPESASVT